VGALLPARSIVVPVFADPPEEALMNNHVSAALLAVKVADIARSHARKRRCAR